MPLYAYRCDNCGVEFERLQKFSDKPIKVCPECNKKAVKRVIQPAGIVFKGSGWYKTDSRSSSSGSSSSSGKSPKKSGGGSSDSSSSSSGSSGSSGSTPASDK